jgi:hypothetical protein
MLRIAGRTMRPRSRLRPSFETPLRGSQDEDFQRRMTAFIFILHCGKKLAHSELPGNF